jgi:hypothetical protein
LKSWRGASFSAAIGDLAAATHRRSWEWVTFTPTTENTEHTETNTGFSR